MHRIGPILRLKVLLLCNKKTMKIIDRLRLRNQTAFIRIDTHNCVACWRCIEACPKEVLGKIDFIGHRHVKIKNGKLCIGCMKCVRTCPHNAIIPLRDK